MDSATETKTVAGDLRKLPQDDRGLIAKYSIFRKRKILSRNVVLRLHNNRAEIKQLGQSDFVKYDEMRGIHFYRKPKKFEGLQ